MKINVFVFFHSYGMSAWGCVHRTAGEGVQSGLFFLPIFATRNTYNMLIYNANHIPSLTGREGDGKVIAFLPTFRP
jgi:hypothetical protein